MDAFFVGFSGFFISLVVIRYFTRSSAAIVTSVAIGVLCAIFFIYRKSKKTNTLNHNNKEKKNMEETMLTLNFMAKKDVVALFENLIKKHNLKYEKKRDILYVSGKKVVIFSSCGIDGASKADVVKLYNLTPQDYTGAIFCTDASTDVIDFAARFADKIKIVSGEKIYGYLKEADLLPKKTVSIDSVKPKQKFLSVIFSKKRARSFFLLGIFFLTCSFFVPIKLYYVIFGTVFMAYSVLCRFFAPNIE